MPRLPIDYSKTIFYRIVCNDLTITECYIGQTTNFIKRKQEHKKVCNNENQKNYNLKVYKFIRENGGWMNWSMIMIEQISCENFNEASKIERKFLEEYKGTLNSNIPSRTKKEFNKEYKELNKDKIKEKDKEYRKLNKDKKKEYDEINKYIIKQYQKEYYIDNIDKIKEYQELNKDKIKEYQELNKDKIKEYNKEYYQKKKLLKDSSLI
jgi:glutamate synthase domain-containing protein 2